jgi:hypothetical protein
MFNLSDYIKIFMELLITDNTYFLSLFSALFRMRMRKMLLPLQWKYRNVKRSIYYMVKN